MAERAKECTICFEIFLKPTLLPCRHSYCEKCIHGLAKGSSKLQCPLCKSFCDVDQIVHDFQTENFVEAFQQLEEEFNQRLVAATAALHPEPASLVENILTAPKKCELCDDNEIAFWCVECKQWICISCKKIHLNTTFTKDHHIEQLSVKNKEVELLLQHETEDLKAKIDEFHRFITSLQNEKKITQDIQLATLKQSRELRAQVMLEVNDKFNNIDQDILARTEKYSSLLQKDISRYQKQVLEFEKKYQAFLATIKKNDPKLAIDGAHEVEQAKELVKNTKSPDMCITSLTIKLQRLQEWSAKAVTIEINGGSIAPKKGHWQRQQSVSTPNYPRCLRNVGNHLYQCHAAGITIYNAQLQQVNSIALGDMGCVFDVCAMFNGDLVVAASNGLYHTKTDSKQAKQLILKGEFTGVIRHHNRFYAVHCYTKIVHVFEFDGEWKQRDTFTVNGKKGGTITVCISNGLLYTCPRGDHKIDIYSLDGHFQSSTGCIGSGEAGRLNLPFICTRDDTGAVLIADQNNNRLQLLSASGQWSIVPLQPPVHLPRGACFMNEALYVNEFTKNSLSVYKME